MNVTLCQATPNAVKTIAQIASICYDSEPTNALGLVKHLYENGHHSVFEHIYFTFKIEGISRACSHQVVRHRLCSFTQRSQRYCSETDFEFVIPNFVTDQSDVPAFYSVAMEEARTNYKVLRVYGATNEDARMLLPNACCTELYLSCNLRELIHIANERLCSRAQWEIRSMVRNMISLVDPELQFMLVPKCESKLMICNNPCKREVRK